MNFRMSYRTNELQDELQHQSASGRVTGRIGFRMSYRTKELQDELEVFG
jgi:hypothetical protein